MKRIIHHSG